MFNRQIVPNIKAVVGHLLSLVKGMQRNILTYSFLMYVALFANCFTTEAGQYGSLQRSAEVNSMFENFVILKDHHYYYQGPEAAPHVIIGIQQSYTLKQDFWKKIDLTREKLKDWLSLMSLEEHELQYMLYGSKIIDGKGKQIGIWYSRWDRATIIVEKKNQVIIYPPSEPDFHKRNRRLPGVVR